METAGPPRPEHSGTFTRFARDSALFTLGSVAGKVIAVIVVPVLTRLLTPADFGRYDVMSTLATVLTSIGVLGLDVAATRLYPQREDHRSIFATWSALTLAIGISAAVVLAATGPQLSEAFFGSDTYAIGFAFVGVAVLGNLFQVVGLTALRNQGRPVTYAGVSSSAFITAGALVIALVVWRESANAAIAGIAGGLCIGGAAAMIAARRITIGPPSRDALRALFKLGFPLVPALAATWLSELFNRTILLGFGGAAEVGYLSVAIRIGSVGLLVVTGFQLAWQPRAFAMGESAEALARVATDARRIVVASCAAMVPFGLLAPEIVTVVSGDDYLPAVGAVGLSLTQAMAFGLFVVATMPASISQRMRDVGTAAVVASLAAVAFNFALAPTWGATGTAGALAAGQMVGVIVAIVLSPRAVAVPLDWWRMLLVSATAAGVICAATLIDDMPLHYRLALGLPVLIVLWAEGAVAEAWTALGRWRRRSSGD